MIRILFYNIHGALGCDGKHDYSRLGEFLKEQKIDIALIQELDTRWNNKIPVLESLDQLKSAYLPHALTAPTIDNHQRWLGNAILSRFPLIDDSVIQMGVTGREPRLMLRATAETPEGPVHVVNTHLGLSRRERHSQLSQLNDTFKVDDQIPLIVGGDMNEWDPLAPALRSLNRSLHPVKTAKTFPTIFPIFRLDRVWCRPRNLISKARVLKNPLTRDFSDHYPVLVEAQL